MALDPADQRILKDAFVDAMRDYGAARIAGGGSAAPSSPGAAVPSINPLTKAAEEGGAVIKGVAGGMVDAGKAMLDNNVRLSSVTGAFEKNLNSAGGTVSSALGKIAGTGTDVARWAEKSLDTQRDLSKSGANFNNSLVEMRNAQAGTRMGLEDYTDVIKKNSQQMTSLGSSVSNGALRFSKLSDEFMNSGAGDYLSKLGYTTKEQNELLLQNMINNRAAGMNEEEANAKAIKDTKAMAEEMRLMADLTGQDRKAKQDEMQKQSLEGKQIAAIRLMEAKGITDFGSNLQMAQAQASKAGPGYERLVRELAIHGRAVSEEARAAQGLYGKSAAQAAQAMQMMKSQDAATREAGKKLMDEASKQAVVMSGSTTMLQNAVSGTGSAINKAAESAVQGGNSTYEAGKKFAEANGMAYKSQEDQKKALDALTESQRKNLGATDGMTNATIQTENRLKDAAAGAQQGLLGMFKKGSSVDKALDDYAKTLEGTGGNMKEATKKTLDDLTGVVGGGTKSAMANALKEGISGSGKEKDKTLASKELADLAVLMKSGIADKTIAEKAKAEKVSPEEYMKKIGNAGAEEIGKLNAAIRKDAPASAKVAEGSGKGIADRAKAAGEDKKASDKEPSNPILELAKQTLKVQVTNWNSFPGIAKKATGSLGTTGKMIEDFGSGTLAMLHGKEGVITEDQMKKFAMGASGAGAANLGQEMTKGLKQIAGAGSSGSMPKLELPTNVSTSVSAKGSELSNRKKDYTEDFSSYTDKEKENAKIRAQNNLEAETKRLADADAKIADLKTASATRQLTSDEQADLIQAEKSKVRAEKSIADKQDKLDVLANLDKYALQMQEDSKKQSVEEVKSTVDAQLEALKTGSNNITEQLTDFSAGMTIPNFDEFGNEIKDSLTSTVDSAGLEFDTSFGDMFGDLTSQFQDMSTGMELPDFSDKFGDLTSQFKDMSAGMELPDFDMFGDLSSQFKDMKVPDLGDFNDSFGELQAKAQADLGEFAGLDDAIAKQADKTPKLDFNKIGADIKKSVVPKVGPGDLKMTSDVGDKARGISTDVAKKAAEKAEAEKKAKEVAAKKDDTTKAETKTTEKPIEMKDLHKALLDLNKTMKAVMQNTETMTDLSSKQVRATKGLSTNLNDR